MRRWPVQQQRGAADGLYLRTEVERYYCTVPRYLYVPPSCGQKGLAQSTQFCDSQFISERSVLHYTS